MPYKAIELGALFLLFVGLFKYVFAFEFEPILRFLAPAIAVFFGFSSLLFNRARAYSSGASRVRTLYAAERAMQATMFLLVGMFVGGGIYALFLWYGFAPGQKAEVKHLFLLVFFLPYFYIQTAFACFLFSLRCVGREFLRYVSPFEMLRRVKEGLDK